MLCNLYIMKVFTHFHFIIQPVLFNKLAYTL